MDKLNKEFDELKEKQNDIMKKITALMMKSESEVNEKSHDRPFQDCKK